MKRLSIVVMATVFGSSAAQAYDSIACGPPDVRADCEGLEAARTPWFRSEHAELWRRTRVLAGLPDEVDAPFEVATPTLGLVAGDEWRSLLPAPLDLATTIERRQLEVSVFAQLPDKSWALWDWVSGNEGCPPLGGDDIDGCHAFTAHMGWLKPNHFLPQAEVAFEHHHALAIERAAACAAMSERLSDNDEAQSVLNACDREALILEAIAQHYLQDAWSMGHMWQRWGSPDVADFSSALTADTSLVSVKALGDAVGRASGIIHGARAISGVPDAMCAPDTGVAFVYGDEQIVGAGDLFLDQVNEASSLFDQRDLMYGCAATAMREVYGSSARSFGALGASSTLEVSLDDCFPQRATNRAIGLGAAIQLPAEVDGILASAGFLAASSAYLGALGLGAEASPSYLYLPLTSSILSAIRIGGGLIDAALVERWDEDMSAIQRTLQVAVSVEPESTSLADGGLGPLLSMQPNAAYDGVADYTDPPLPWVLEAAQVPLEPRVEQAGNLLARTFVDAHADDWCDAFADNTLEADLPTLRAAVETARGTPDEAAACEVCTQFATWHVWPSFELEHRAEDAPICERLVNGSAATVKTRSATELYEDFVVVTAGSPADLWCGCGVPVIAYRPPGTSVCDNPDNPTYLDLLLVRVSEDGESVVEVPALEVVVTGEGVVFDTTQQGAQILGVEVGPGSTALHISIPALDVDMDFTVRADIEQCDRSCDAYYALLGPDRCQNQDEDGNRPFPDPNCCCCT